jgi:23S rRNA (cytosine1962-C5)-methyltransferase
MSRLPRIVLKRGKEKPLLRGHPWVFSGAVAKIEGDVMAGDMGEATSADGQFLGIGHLNPQSQIVFRLLSQNKGSLGIDFFKERISTAAAWRERWFKGKTTAYRMINGEGDFLPGLVLDRYGEIFVLQFLTAGMDRLKDQLVELLAGEYRPKSIYERSDTATREEEGLPQRSGLLYGEAIPDHVEVEEYGCRFYVDVRKGQKTGFYLDQRENRHVVREVSGGKRILDCFCYTGAFSIHGALGGAKEIVLVDSSEEALDRAEVHFGLNDLGEVPHRFMRGNVFEIIRTLDPGYDIVLLDPPPFAKKKGHVSNASRGYKELNLQAFRLLKKEGLLFTFSCSHHISFDLFQKIVFAAALDAEREVQLVSRRGHPVDHPISLYHPEGEYLKGFICRVL